MFNIHKFSHHFVVEEPDGYLQNAIDDYSRQFLLQTQSFKLWNNKVVKKQHKMFGVRTTHPLRYRFHINMFDHFMSFMTQKGFTHYNITKEPMYTPKPADFKIATSKTPWKNQPAIIDYLVDNGDAGDDAVAKVIELQAGQGKTLCALFAAQRIGVRTGLIIKAMYVERWLDDLARPGGVYELNKSEITVVRGSKNLANLIELGLNDELEYKFIVFSNKTIALYYKDYIKGVDMDKYHGVMPWDLMKVLGIGLRITDEAHQDFHSCFKVDLFSHVPKTISLSATLEPDDAFLKEMYKVIYPKHLRYGGATYEVYVDVIAVPFKIDREVKQQVRFNQRGMLSYSQNVYEDSILSSKKRTKSYLEMITFLVDRYFIQKRYKDYRLIIFSGRVETCATIVAHLQTIYPNLRIGKYTEEESYEILDELDIVVSTPISAGTAVDISKLQVCLNLVALGSTQANLQMLGRLRELHGVDINPLFLYIYCVDIEKHIYYHTKRRDETFKGKVLSYVDLEPAVFSV